MMAAVVPVTETGAGIVAIIVVIPLSNAMTGFAAISVSISMPELMSGPMLKPYRREDVRVPLLSVWSRHYRMNPRDRCAESSSLPPPSRLC